MTPIRYNMRVSETEVLGPGRRAVFWTQGCSRMPPCENCIGDSTRDPAGGILGSTREMAQWICSLSNIDGITVSGGEPFDQAAAVAEVICLVRSEKPDLSLVVYTGRRYETLLEQTSADPAITSLLSQTQVLVDGPYIPALDDGVPYRGSSNQRILILDDSFRPTAEHYYTDKKGRKIEVISGSENTWLVGIPSKNQADAWRRLKSAGNATKTKK